MNGQNNLLKNIASLVAVASVSALLTIPALAQLNANKSSVNSVESTQGSTQVQPQNSAMSRSTRAKSGAMGDAMTDSTSSNAMTDSNSMRQKRSKGAYDNRSYKTYNQSQRSSGVRALW